MNRLQTIYQTPENLPDLLLFSDGTTLTGSTFLPKETRESTPMPSPFAEACTWLDRYFAGDDPGKLPKLHFTAGTPFQREVWSLLCEIPYGELVTYGSVAACIARKHGIPKMSAQAVGQAVNRNPIAIIVPCHRVVGSRGELTGYGGGLTVKAELLKTEGYTLNPNDRPNHVRIVNFTENFTFGAKNP